MTIELGTDDLNALEDTFGIPRGYIDSLKNEDDWTLILKSQALLESACADMLTHYFRNHNLAGIFSHLDMGNESFGKIAFLSKLNLLGKKERGFLRKLLFLRNLVVHNASNITFSLKDYVKNLKPKELTAFSKAINTHLASIEITDPGEKAEKISGNDLILIYPKMVIWSSLIKCLGKIYTENVLSVERNRFISEKLKERQDEGPRKLDHTKISIKIDRKKK